MWSKVLGWKQTFVMIKLLQLPKAERDLLLRISQTCKVREKNEIDFMQIKKKISLANLYLYLQCDQIWQNFATLVRILKSLAILWSFIKYLAYLSTLSSKFSLLKIAKKWIII